jgi:hypothetical protein
MRKGFDSLAAQAQAVLGQDPFPRRDGSRQISIVASAELYSRRT